MSTSNSTNNYECIQYGNIAYSKSLQASNFKEVPSGNRTEKEKDEEIKPEHNETESSYSNKKKLDDYFISLLMSSD